MTGSALADETLAEAHCARCHAIGESGESPLAAAPTFRDIANRYPPESLAESFAEGIMTGHADMPEFTFTAEETAQLIEHFKTLVK